MGFVIDHNRALIRGLLAGVVVLAGASACSGDNRTETGTVRDTSAVISADTASTQTTNAPSPPAPDQSASAAGSDTSAAAETPAPRSKTGVAGQTTQDTNTAGYRGMERDTSAAVGVDAPSDSARAPADTTLPGDQSSAAPSDSADTVSTEVATTDTSITTDVAAGQDTLSADIATPDTAGHQAVVEDSSTEMAGAAVTTDTAAQPPAADTVSINYAETARDTSAASTVADSGVIQAHVDTAHADSAVAVSGGISAEADVAVAGEVDTTAAAADSVAVSVQADTTTEARTEVAVQDTPDSITVVGDSSSVDNPGPRAKEDTISAKADSLAQYGEADRIRPPEDSTEIAGGVTPAEEARPDEVGAARISGEVTGAAALAGTTFQGAQCAVADNTSDDAIVLDMSNTPASLNPCGLGSMVPTRFWTKKE
jgi:hypothetical protein